MQQAWRGPKIPQVCFPFVYVSKPPWELPKGLSRQKAGGAALRPAGQARARRPLWIMGPERLSRPCLLATEVLLLFDHQRGLADGRHRLGVRVAVQGRLRARVDQAAVLPALDQGLRLHLDFMDRRGEGTQVEDERVRAFGPLEELEFDVARHEAGLEGSAGAVGPVE